MTWKVLGINNAGNSGQYGSDDLDKYARLFNGNLDVDTVDFNSLFYVTSGKFRFWDVSRTHYIDNIFAENTANRTLTWPALTINDSVVYQDSTQRLKEKIIDARENYITGVVNFPSRWKTGHIQCTSPTEIGYGLLDGHTKMGTPTQQTDADGSYWRFTTTSTANTQRGFYKNTIFVRRDYDPWFHIKWRETSASTNDTKLWIGFTSVITTLGTTLNAPLGTTDKGLMIGHAQADTNYRYYLSDGSGGTIVNEAIPGTTKNNLIHEVELRFINSLNTAYVKFDTLDEFGIGTEVPASTSGFTINVTFQNTAAVDRTFDVFWVEMVSAK